MKNNEKYANIQDLKDSRNVALDLAGIKKFRIPVKIKNSDSTIQNTIATIDAYTSLSSNKRGVHLSNIIKTIKRISEINLDKQSFEKIVFDLANLEENADVKIIMNFAYFIEKESPISKEKIVLDYDCSLIGEWKNKKSHLHIGVSVPVMTLCPDSKELTKCAAHNQRAIATIKAQGNIWFEDLIKIAESSASSEIFQILRKADDKYVMEQAYENPKFVEDFIRDVAVKIRKKENISSAEISIEALESNHNYNAYAHTLVHNKN